MKIIFCLNIFSEFLCPFKMRQVSPNEILHSNYTLIRKILGTRPLPFQFVFNDAQSWQAFFLLHGHLWIAGALIMITALVARNHHRWKIWLLLATGIGYYLAINTILIMDRLNTVFKAASFGNEVFWILLAQTGVVYWRWSRYLRWSFAFGAVLLLVAGIPLWFAISRHFPPGLAQREFISPALNLEQQDLVRYVNKNITGTPGILEPQAASYQFNASLVNLNTGLPTYLGWDQHVWVQGHPYHQVMARKEQLPQLLANFQQPEVQATLKKAGIVYLLVPSSSNWSSPQGPFSVVYASSNYLLLSLLPLKK